MDTLLSERRLVSRMLHRWKQMAIGQKLPAIGDIDPWLVGDDWHNCVLIDLNPSPRQASFIMVGDNLLPEGAHDLTDRPIAQVPGETLLGTMLLQVPRVAESGMYFLVEGDTSVRHGVPILYRSVLLPLSTDGRVVDSILGAANYRELRDTDYPLATDKLGTRLFFGRRNLSEDSGASGG